MRIFLRSCMLAGFAFILSPLNAAEHNAEDTKSNRPACELTSEEQQTVNVALEDFEKLKIIAIGSVEGISRNLNRGTTRNPPPLEEKPEEARLKILKNLIPLIKKEPLCAENFIEQFLIVLKKERQAFIKESKEDGDDITEIAVIKALRQAQVLNFLMSLQELALSRIAQKPSVSNFKTANLTMPSPDRLDIVYSHSIKPYYDVGTYIVPQSNEKEKILALPKLLITDFQETRAKDGTYHQKFRLKVESAIKELKTVACDMSKQSTDATCEKDHNADWTDIRVTNISMGEVKVHAPERTFTATEEVINEITYFTFETKTQNPIAEGPAFDFIVDTNVLVEGSSRPVYLRTNANIFDLALKKQASN